MMCCTPYEQHAGLKGYACCIPSGTMPFMWSKRKTIKALEQYLEKLREEIKDVEDQLTELKKEK